MTDNALTIDEIQAIAAAIDAAIRAAGIQALENPALGVAVRKLQGQANEIAETDIAATDDNGETANA